MNGNWTLGSALAEPVPSVAGVNPYWQGNTRAMGPLRNRWESATASRRREHEYATLRTNAHNSPHGATRRFSTVPRPGLVEGRLMWSTELVV
jgi:hypothetical protein